MGRSAMSVGTGNRPIMYNTIRNSLTEKKKLYQQHSYSKNLQKYTAVRKCTKIHRYSKNVEKDMVVKKM